MAYEEIDLTTVQPDGKVGEPTPTAWGKAKRMFIELYRLWQTDANKLGYFDANGAPAFTAFTAYARSLIAAADGSAALKVLGLGTPGTTGISLLAAGDEATGRSVLKLGSAALMSTVGTAVSGGASGAIIERGSNSSGNYTRYADGTQECWSTPSFSASANAASSFSLGFAASFADTPSVTLKMVAGNSGSRVDGIEFVSKTVVSGFIFNNTSSTMTGSLHMRAVGRWY